jgi:hypothetical protein
MRFPTWWGHLEGFWGKGKVMFWTATSIVIFARCNCITKVGMRVQAAELACMLQKRILCAHLQVSWCGSWHSDILCEKLRIGATQCPQMPVCLFQVVLTRVPIPASLQLGWLHFAIRNVILGCISRWHCMPSWLMATTLPLFTGYNTYIYYQVSQKEFLTFEQWQWTCAFGPEDCSRQELPQFCALFWHPQQPFPEI